MNEQLSKDGFNNRRADRVAVVGWLVIGLFALCAVFAGFLAPYDHSAQSRFEPSAPATTIHFDGLTPIIHPRRVADPLRRTYTEDTSEAFPLGLFVRGSSYKLLGIVETDVHLFGVRSTSDVAPRINLLGTDQLGRDRFSRLLYAIRFSFIVALIGVLVACVVGILIGGVSGYAGRLMDTFLMGVTDAMLALPTLILILGVRAAFPLELPMTRAALLLLLIFALTGWAEMARLTRGLVLSFRKREFVVAAVALGVSQTRVLFRHILPNILPPLRTRALLLLPTFLLAEVALSYLGVGLQEPEPSLGNMLTAASDLDQLRSQPFNILSPALAVLLFTLGVRLIGRNERA
ncbi:MAG TPA: ABC transporter permease [Pyrinomonadaceae bacterium]|nr:ABC transporter permease [Pyrinomonadaceae bacterium]